MINSSERSDILVFNCYLCHVRFLLTYYVCSTKIGEISDISKCFENFVSQTLGVLTRIYAAELRYTIIIPFIIVNWCLNADSFQPTLFTISSQHSPMVLCFMAYTYNIIIIFWFFIILLFKNLIYLFGCFM